MDNIFRSFRYLIETRPEPNSERASSGEGGSSPSESEIEKSCDVDPNENRFVEPPAFLKFCNLFKRSLHYCKFLAKENHEVVYYFDLSDETETSIGLAQYWIGVLNMVKNKHEKGLKYLKMAENYLDPSCNPMTSGWVLNVLFYIEDNKLFGSLDELLGRVNSGIKFDQAKFMEEMVKNDGAIKNPLRRHPNLEYLLVGNLALQIYNQFKDNMKDNEETYYILKFAALECKEYEANQIFKEVKAKRKCRIQQETSSPASEPNLASLDGTLKMTLDETCKVKHDEDEDGDDDDDDEDVDDDDDSVVAISGKDLTSSGVPNSHELEVDDVFDLVEFDN